MSKNHLLVKKAFVYSSKKELKDPENCEYDNRCGLWLWGNNKEVLVKSDSPNRPRAGTKKADIETGEDSKGE